METGAGDRLLGSRKPRVAKVQGPNDAQLELGVQLALPGGRIRASLERASRHRNPACPLPGSAC
jgi:hypothetical protein